MTYNHCNMSISQTGYCILSHVQCKQNVNRCTTGAEVMKILGKPHGRVHIIFQIFSLRLELNACMKNPRKLNVSQPQPFNENVHNP